MKKVSQLANFSYGTTHNIKLNIFLNTPCVIIKRFLYLNTHNKQYISLNTPCVTVNVVCVIPSYDLILT